MHIDVLGHSNWLGTDQTDWRGHSVTDDRVAVGSMLMVAGARYTDRGLTR